MSNEAWTITAYALSGALLTLYLFLSLRRFDR
jgi:predicted MFS family arabinose efflux permease